MHWKKIFVSSSDINFNVVRNNLIEIFEMSKLAKFTSQIALLTSRCRDMNRRSLLGPPSFINIYKRQCFDMLMYLIKSNSIFKN